MAEHIVYETRLEKCPMHNPTDLIRVCKEGWLLRSIIRAKGQYHFRFERPVKADLHRAQEFQLKLAPLLDADLSVFGDEGWSLATILFLPAEEHYAFYLQRPL